MIPVHINPILPKHMDWSNSALLQDEVLLNVVLSLEEEFAPGPAFLASIGSLVEALVLHEHVYFDPARIMARDQGDIRSVHGVLRSSSTIKYLIEHGALKPFPARDVVVRALSGAETPYRHGEFLADYFWGQASFSFPSANGQKHLYDMITYLAQEHPELLSAETLTSDDEDEPISKAIISAQRLIQKGVPVENLIDIEAMSRRTRAFVGLTRALGVNAYLVDTAVPFQLEQIKNSNSRVRQIYTKLMERIDEMDKELDAPDFQEVRIPPLAQIAFARAKDSRDGLMAEILALRERHQQFRATLTAHDRAWKTAATRAQRLALKNDFLNAWKTIVSADERSQTRMIYTIWDIIKNPTKILQGLGDLLVSKGKEQAIISRMGGLHPFWRELSEAPVPDHGVRMIARMFPKQLPTDVWKSASGFGEAIQKQLT